MTTFRETLRTLLLEELRRCDGDEERLLNLLDTTADIVGFVASAAARGDSERARGLLKDAAGKSAQFVELVTKFTAPNVDRSTG
jgi:hypothetical protein